MASTAAARRYARALFQLAREGDAVADVRGQLADFAELLEQSDELSHVLMRPLYPVAERRAVLRAVTQRLGANSTVVSFFAYLIDRRRIVDFPAIRTEYERLADEAAGRVRADVATASPLDDARRERLARVLSQRTGSQIDLDVRVDPELIGGVVARVGDLIFDGSLRTQLRQLHANLTKGH